MPIFIAKVSFNTMTYPLYKTSGFSHYLRIRLLLLSYRSRGIQKWRTNQVFIRPGTSVKPGSIFIVFNRHALASAVKDSLRQF